MPSKDDVVFYETTHQYFINKKETISVTTSFEKIGITDWSHVPEEAKVRGDYVHRIAEMYFRGTLDEITVDPDLVGYLMAIKKFHVERVKNVLELETIVYDAGLGYAGRIDIVYEDLEGFICLDDWKTAVEPHQSVKWQTAAYTYAFQKQRKIKIDKRHGVWLSKDGTYQLDEHGNSLRKDFNDFVTILRAAILKVENKIK